MMKETEYTSVSSRVARSLAYSEDYADKITGVEIRFDDNLGGQYTTVELANSYNIAITTLNDKYGDMFTIVAYHAPVGKEAPSRSNIALVESGSVKKLKKTLANTINKLIENYQ